METRKLNKVAFVAFFALAGFCFEKGLRAEEPEADVMKIKKLVIKGKETDKASLEKQPIEDLSGTELELTRYIHLESRKNESLEPKTEKNANGDGVHLIFEPLEIKTSWEIERKDKKTIKFKIICELTPSDNPINLAKNIDQETFLKPRSFKVKRMDVSHSDKLPSVNLYIEDYALTELQCYKTVALVTPNNWTNLDTSISLQDILRVFNDNKNNPNFVKEQPADSQTVRAPESSESSLAL